MKLYKLSQEINDGYDTYDSCVVCAENEEKARLIHPSEFVTHHDDENWYGTYTKGGEYIIEDYHPSWVERDRVNEIKVEYIGEAKEGMEEGVVVASFNAG
jgi:hypothetical protein